LKAAALGLALFLGLAACRFSLEDVARPCAGDAECPAGAACSAEGRCVFAAPPPDGGANIDDGGPASDDGGATSDGGTIVADGGSPQMVWSEMALPPSTECIYGLFGRSPTDVLAGTNSGQILHYDGMAWTPLSERDPSNFSPVAIWASSTRIYIGDSGGAFWRTDGSTPWERFLPPGAQIVNAVWGYSDTEVYLVTEGLRSGFYLFDGAQLNALREEQGGGFNALWGPIAGTVYFGGSQGRIFRFAAGEITQETVAWPAGFTSNQIAEMTFHAIHGVGTEVFAVGMFHSIYRRDAGTWRPIQQGSTGGDLRGVSGSATDGYAIGSPDGASPILRYDGAWSPQNVSDTYDLFGIWSASADEYFASGCFQNSFDGLILHGHRR
jgi:hypothetical protein